MFIEASKNVTFRMTSIDSRKGVIVYYALLLPTKFADTDFKLRGSTFRRLTEI